MIYISYYCEICGRKCKKKIRYGGYTLCSKHMHQLHSYGKFLDNIPRTRTDLNDYRIVEDVAYFNLYNGKNSEKIAEFIIDKEDIEKIKYHKWRLSHSHVITGLPAKGTQRELSWVILGLDNRLEKNKGIVVDHINCDPLDNRKSNLRICKQSENVLNKSFMSNNTIGFIGVTYRKNRNAYDPEIRKNGIRCHLGYVHTLEEAVYKRYIAESLVFGEFANKEEQNKKYEFSKNLPQEKKDELERIVKDKLKAKNLLAISYVEVPDMSRNTDAVLQILNFIYDNIMYAEINSKFDYCQCCGYSGEIQIKGEPGHLYWECPNCGNTDQNKMNVSRRTCGYVGTNFWNQGRTEEIKDRVLHIDW